MEQIKKGFGDKSPNNNRVDCGEQGRSQGKQSVAMFTGGDTLAKIVQEFVERENKVNEVSNYHDL